MPRTSPAPQGRFPRAAALIAGLSLAIIPAARCDAATLRVPDEYATIQEAVDRCADGDTVFVRSGLYAENVVLPEPAPSIALIGENPQSTIIDAGGEGKCIRIRNPSQSTGSVENFTLQNSGIGYTGSIINCAIGISTDGTGSWTVRNNILRDHPQHGILTTDVTTIAENLFLDIAFRAIFASSHASPTIVGNDFIDCGYGIYVHAGVDQVTIANNIIAFGDTGMGTQGPLFTSECNNLWELKVAYDGCGAGESDFSADPHFCDADGEDFRLRSDSPCLGQGGDLGCGLVGAFTEGCGAIAVDETSWGRIKLLFRR